MARQLDRTYLACPIHAGALERPAQHHGTIDRIETEVAVKFFRCLCNTIRVMHLRPSREPYRLGLPVKHTDQAIDKQGGSVRRSLLMVRVLPCKHMSGILDQSMLEPASGADKGPVPLAGELNPPQSAFHADVWAARGRPQRIEGIEELVHGVRTQRAGGKP
jgi:hypothetical protein